MIMYKQTKTIEGQVRNDQIQRVADGAYIPFDPANTDYANFKKEILADEAQLQDADGKTMTANKAKEFVATLP
jgi:hypothetical protein